MDSDRSVRSDVLIENVARIAQAEPDRVFAKVLFRNRAPVTVTYGSLLDHAGRYASLYKHRGVAPGDVVVIILDHGPELFHAFVGALLYRAVPSIFAQPSIKIASDEYSRTISKLLEVCNTPYLVTEHCIADQLPLPQSNRSGVQPMFSEE